MVIAQPVGSAAVPANCELNHGILAEFKGITVYARRGDLGEEEEE